MVSAYKGDNSLFLPNMRHNVGEKVAQVRGRGLRDGGFLGCLGAKMLEGRG